MTGPGAALDAAAAIEAWEALGRPPIPIAVNERGQVYKTILRTTEPSTAAERAAAIAWVRDRAP